MAEHVDITIPPSLAPQKNPDALVAYFQADEVSRALLNAGFSAEEEIGTLVDMFRNAGSEWARLAAHARLNARLKESLMLSGKVRTLTASMESEKDGVVTQLEAQAIKLFDSALTETNAANKNLLPQLENTNESTKESGATGEYVDAEFSIESEGGVSGDPEKEPSLTAGGDEAAIDELDTYRPFAEGHYPPSVRGRAGIASVGATILGEKARAEDAVIESVVRDASPDAGE